MIDQICEFCGGGFHAKPSAKRKFCSRACYFAHGHPDRRKPESWWVDEQGYIRGRVWEDGVQRKVKQHRWLVEKQLGRRLLPSEDVHHKNEDKANNPISNLELIDHGDHTSLHKSGERHEYMDGAANPNAKLTEDSVRSIRAEYDAGAKIIDLSRKYGLLRNQISLVARRLSWCHVRDDVHA